MIGLFRRFDRAVFRRMETEYDRMLASECAGYRTLLDVGCGSNSPVRHFSRAMERVTGIDGFQPAIERSRAAGIHHEYRLMDVMDMTKEFREESFDVVFAADLIEHFQKADGHRLIEMMERVARHKVVIFTPNGFLEQRAYDGNNLQVHLSGWGVTEMEALGYRVAGVGGWRPLRGEFATVRWWPRGLWGRLSLLTQRLTHRWPRWAFALLCVKEFPPKDLALRGVHPIRG